MISTGLHPPAFPGNKTCIIITGPTAVGKTVVAIQLAQYFKTEIISCDSRQCFKELNIGVAKPSAEELNLVNHYFINSHSIHDVVNASVFEKYALENIHHIFKANDVAVMVGGTGLYIKAFCDGMDEVPAINENIRRQLNDDYKKNGIGWLQEQVKENDLLYFATGEIQNPHRLLRALEVKLSTGKSIVEFQTKQKKKKPFNIVKIGLELPRPALNERIDQRVAIMMQDGLLEEVRSLIPYQDLNALKTVGYRELFAFFNKESTMAGAIESININTRQYAKRQMTWFRKDTEINWCSPVFEDVLLKLNVLIPRSI